MAYVTICAAPLLNTPENPFKNPLKRDSQGRLMEMEMVLFPHTPVTVLEKKERLWRIQTPAYPSPQPVYIEPKFLKQDKQTTDYVDKKFSSAEVILKKLKELLGIRYFWGGNWPSGIPQMLEIYPDLKNLNPEEQKDALCQGVDCSGLLYYATEGKTPRNTSDLIHFGIEVNEDVKPLDLVVWKGHVVIVVSSDSVLESRIDKGVVLSPLTDRLEEVKKITQDGGKQLYIRRWHPEQ